MKARPLLRPSSRTKAQEAAGAETPLSGLLGAALLAAAALLLAPETARAQTPCGDGGMATSNCPNQDYPDGIAYGVAGSGNSIAAGGPQTFNILSHSTGPITLTAGAGGSPSAREAAEGDPSRSTSVARRAGPPTSSTSFRGRTR